MPPKLQADSAEEVKQCCAKLYENDFARLLLGDSFHPGGLKLSERLGELLQLTRESRVLDVAAGRGASAFFLAERFGCAVTGIDYSQQNVEFANEMAASRGLSARVRFEHADAERLSFARESFDAVVCECAFCTFPDKDAVAREFARVLRPGGRIGLSDMTRGPVLPQELENLLGRVACLADARSAQGYADFLRGASLVVGVIEPHDEALVELVREIRMKLLSTELMIGLGKLELPGIDLDGAKRMAQSALRAIQTSQLGYAIVTAHKPA